MLILSRDETQTITNGKEVSILIPLDPQPSFEPVGNTVMWQWKDCQWMDGGLGFPKSGIEDYAPYKLDEMLFPSYASDDGMKNIHTVVAGVDVKKMGLWYWVVALKPAFGEVHTHFYIETACAMTRPIDSLAEADHLDKTAGVPCHRVRNTGSLTQGYVVTLNSLVGSEKPMC